jgi:hypothetical protein
MFKTTLLAESLGAASNIPFVTPESKIYVLANAPVEFSLRDRTRKPPFSPKEKMGLYMATYQRLQF